MAKKKAAKKAAKRSRAAVRPTIDPEVIDRVVLALIQEPLDSTVCQFCVAELGIPCADVDRYVAEARRRLTIASKFHRDRELAAGIRNLKRALSIAATKADPHGMVAAQQAINKLLALQQPAPQEEQRDASKESPEAKAIRDHLVPLGLADESAALSEHVRIAALTIIDTMEASK